MLDSSELVAAAAEVQVRDEISTMLAEELERAEREQEHSLVPELLRLKGEFLLLDDHRDPETARHCFVRSVERARAQGALAWELRSTISLASLERAHGQTGEARRLLQAVYDRFIEGFDTSDLKRAKHLLDEWSSAPG